MHITEKIQREEKDYLDAIKKANDFKNALDKLTPQNKERFFRELTGTAITVETINNLLSGFKGGGY